GAAFGDLHGDIAGDAALVAAVLAQIGEAFKAADIALAAGGDAVAQPMLFAHDLAVELMALLFFLLQHFVAPDFERPKALLDAAGNATVEPDRGTREVG